MQALSTALLSSSCAGGSAGSWLWGCSGSQAGAALVMMQKTCFVDRWAAYVADDDTSTKRVLIFDK
jgi:hypothetical protein